MLFHPTDSVPLPRRAAAALTLVCLVGCASTSPWRAPEVLAAPGLEAAGHLTLTPTEEGDAGSIVVAESRDRPNGRTLRLPVRRLRSIGPSLGAPLFILGGGPGLPNDRFEPWEALRHGRDVVIVGYRGVDGSVRLECPEVNQELATVEDIVDTAAARNLGLAFAVCLDRYRQANIDVGAYNIWEMTADLDEARAALGYAQIDLLGMSFGTRVAALYSTRFASHLHRLALVSANPPGHFVWEPDDVDVVMRRYGELWRADPDHLAEATDLVEAVSRGARNMPESWLVVPIRPGKALATAFVLLFHHESAGLALGALLAAAQGDHSGLALLTMMYDEVLPDVFVWGDFLLKGYTADFDPNRDYRSSLAMDDHVMGSPLARYFWSHTTEAMPDPMPVERRRIAPIANETLVLSGELDLSTPARHATADLEPLLRDGRHVIFPGRGHVEDLIGNDVPEGRRMIESFLAQGLPAVASLPLPAAPELRTSTGLGILMKVAAASASSAILIGALLLTIL